MTKIYNVAIVNKYNEYNKGWAIGSAQRENEIYMDSIAGKWNTLKENMKSLVTSNLSSDLFKDILDGASKAVVAIDKISSSLGKFGSMGAMIGIAGFIKDMSNFKDIADSLSGKSFSLATMTSEFGGLTKVASNVFKVFKEGGSMMLSGNLSGGFNALKTGLAGVVSSSGLATTAMIAFKAVLSAIGWGLLITGIGMAVKAFNDYVHASEIAIESSKKRQDGIRDELQTLSSQKANLSGLASEYDKLASKTNLSYEEMVRFKEIKQQIADLSPELVSGYDASGDPILALNGSLTNYVKELENAISKQEKLFNKENEIQTEEILKQNEKDRGNKGYANVRQEWSNWGSTVPDPTEERDKWASIFQGEAKSLEKLAQNRKKWRADQEKSERESLEKISKEKQELLEKDAQVQQTYIDKFLNNKKNESMSQNDKNAFSGFMADFDWGGFTPAEADEMSRAMQKLSECTAFTTKEMGDCEAKTRKANQTFKETGALNAWGKELQSIADESGKFDLQSWSSYFDEVNERMNSGTMSMEEYEYSMGIMAQTMGDLINIDPSIMLDSLMRTGDLESACDSAVRGLNNFMGAYGKSTIDLKDGKDNIAEQLEAQFIAISEFGQNMESQIELEQTITCEWLLEQKENGDLPRQMEKLMELVTSDFSEDPTEIETMLLMNCQAEIQNEGQLSGDTIKKIEGLLDGTLEIENGIEIAGLELSKEEAEALREALQESGKSAEEITLSDTGIEKAKEDAKAFEDKLNSIKNKDIRIALEGAVNTAEEVGLIETAMKDIPEEKQAQFIADTGKFFVGATSVEEAIGNMPDEKKLQYNIGVEGNKELEGLKKIYDNLPESVRTRVNGEVLGAEDVEQLDQLVDMFGEKNVTAMLSVDGAEQSLHDCSTLEEFLETMAGKVTTTDVELEDGSFEEIYELIIEKLKELEENPSKATVEAEVKNKEELDETQEKKKELEKPSKATVETEVKNKEELDETQEKKDKLSEITEAPITEKSQSNGEYEATQEKKDKLSETTEAQVEVQVNNKEELTETELLKKTLEENGFSVTDVQVNNKGEVISAKIEKDGLEQDGTSTTNMEVNGEGKISEADRMKQVLEKNGFSITDIQVNNKGEVTDAKVSKDDLEKSGTSTTNMEVTGTDQISTAKQEVDGLESKEVEVSVWVKAKDTINNILETLGFKKAHTETVEVTVKAKDEASSTIEKVSNAQPPDVSFTVIANAQTATDAMTKLDNIKLQSQSFSVTATGGVEAKNTLEKIVNTSIPSKPFTITATGGAGALNSVTRLRDIKIPHKPFDITCKDTASAKVDTVNRKKIAHKPFNITCKDNASATVSRVDGKKIAHKPFDITCKDKATTTVNKVDKVKIAKKDFEVTCKDSASTKLTNIKNALGKIYSKSITVTTTYKTKGTPPKQQSVNTPQITSPTTQSVAQPLMQSIGDVTTSALGSSAESFRQGVSALNGGVTSTLANTSINAYDTLKSLDYNIDMLTNLNNAIKKVNASLDLNSEKQKNAFGGDKARLIQQEIALLEQQQRLVRENASSLVSMASRMKYYLMGKGFTIGDDGSLDNYNKKMLTLEENVKRLKNAQDAYKGDSESKKNYLASAYNKANEELQKIKETSSEYLKIVFDELPGATTEWEKLKNEIIEAKNAIYEANKEQANFYKDARIKELGYQYDKISHAMDILDSKINLSKDEDKIVLYKQQLALLNQQQEKQQQMAYALKSQQAYFKNFLSSKGFQFGADGDILSGASTLNRLKERDDFESIKDAYEEYMKIQHDSLPDTEKEWWNIAEAEQKVQEEIESIIEAQKKAKEEMSKLVQEARIDEVVQQFESLKNALELIETKMKGAFGTNQIHYLEQQIKLIEKQKEKQEELIALYSQQANVLKGQLSNLGIMFDKDGQITNLDQIMNCQATVEEMEKLKDLADEYFDMQNDNLSGAVKDWYDMNNQIQDLEDSILSATRAMEEMKDEAWLNEFNTDIDIIQSMIDKNESLMDLAGSNQNTLLHERVELYQKLAEETKKLLAYQMNKKGDLAKKLTEYGFVINDNGSIDNTANRLESLKNSMSKEQFDAISESLEEYFDLLAKEIPDLEKEIIDMQKQYEDIQREKLETTKDIEDEITKIYEKQIDERIKRIEEEKDAQIKALNEEKDAYNKWRDEVDYDNDYEDKRSEVEDLERKLSIAQRDTSLSGQKRVKELMEQLADAQKDLEDLVQDKIDKDMNDMFDDQIDQVENNAEEEIKNIEDLWNSSKIAEMIEKALDTGFFEDIDGNITHLDKVMLDFANNSKEYLGVMGDSLKKELIDNLGIALETMKQLDKISQDLKLPDYSQYRSSLSTPTNSAMSYNMNGYTMSPSSVNVGDTKITIEGNASTETIDDLQAMLKAERESMIKQIMNNVK